MLVSLTTLTATMQDSLHELIAAIEQHDGISPINESAALCIAGLRDAEFFFMGMRCEPKGFVVYDARDNALTAGVHPDHRRQGVGTELLSEALAAHPTASVWAFGTLPGAPELAARVGLRPARTLLRMERPLTGLDATPIDVAIRTFRPGDAEDIVAINAAAFAHHPEQGRLTLAEFDQLTEQEWFDPQGLFVAERDGSAVGFHWTKRHGGSLGEVYVIAVAPGHEGSGIGRALLSTGLAYLASRGDEQVQLYVEADQGRVVDLYHRAGFQVVQTDTNYQP